MKKAYYLFAILIISIQLFTNDLCFSQWVQFSNGLPTQYVYVLSKKSDYVIAGTGGGGVYISTNNGSNWVAKNSGLTGNALTINSIATNDTNLYIGTQGAGVYRSTNNGGNWVQINSGLTEQSVFSLIASGSYVFAGCYSNGIFRSTNYGNNWTIGFVQSNNTAFVTFLKKDLNIFCGTSGYGIYRTTDYGNGWYAKIFGLQVLTIPALASNGNYIYAGAAGGGNTGGVYMTTNNGDTWYPINGDLNYLSINCLAAIDSNIFAGVTNGSSNGGVFLSTNYGLNWNAINQGFTTGIGIVEFLIKDDYIFASSGSKVWRRNLSEIITGYNNKSEVTPQFYRLYQNYPNPFNPSTNIRYEIPQNGFIKIIVYDMLGKVIKTLVNEHQTAGTYEVNFEASQYPSGVYYYKLMTNNFTETKSMILLK